MAVIDRQRAVIFRPESPARIVGDRGVADRHAAAVLRSDRRAIFVRDRSPVERYVAAMRRDNEVGIVDMGVREAHLGMAAVRFDHILIVEAAILERDRPAGERLDGAEISAAAVVMTVVAGQEEIDRAATTGLHRAGIRCIAVGDTDIDRAVGKGADEAGIHAAAGQA